MASKIASFVALVVAVAAEIQHPSFYPNSLRYVVADGGDHNVQGAGYSLVEIDGLQRESLPVSYDLQSFIEGHGQGSPWNYLIPVEDSHSTIATTHPEAPQVLPLAAPWTHDVPISYSTSATPTTGLRPLGETPFGYVRPVAKITVPPGYKIH